MIWIGHIGEWWIIGDEDSEFARSTSIDEALRYVDDLMRGPGTERGLGDELEAELASRMRDLVS